MARALVHLPGAIRAGQAFEVQTTIAHPMETGYRPGSDGVPLARDLIRRFSATLVEGPSSRTVFAAELHTAVSANPYLAFYLRLQRSGTLILRWEGDQGFHHEERRSLTVSA
ncbi:MAG: thiosulfate oxidation carrier complex protein SoxZ [Rhodoferax sp.]|nr:thiosulfate oxidation carrier complex protein SoxZ [Rhodoferax sp.]